MDASNHNHLDFSLAFIEGGTFDMGDKIGDLYSACHPVHEVKVDSFYMTKYLVTQDTWESVMGNNPSHFKGAKRPVENVSWLDAKEFIKRLNKQTGKTFRLPTEAEWEYAARGGKLSEGYKYSGSDKLKQVGWYDENSNDQTQEVGQLLANELGLYDMSGNVWEWCEDWYDSNYYKKCKEKGVVENPVNLVEGDRRVLRGGSYFNNAVHCRPADRYWNAPGGRDNDIGFRLVLPFQSVG